MVGILSRTAERGKKTLELVSTDIAQPERVVRSGERRQQREASFDNLPDRRRVLGLTESRTFK